MAINELPISILENLGLVWTFLLLVARFTGMFMVIPGLGVGLRGMMIRMPAIYIMALVSTSSGIQVDAPQDWGVFISGITGEVLFGLGIGLIPRCIVSGVQFAGQLSSTTMGLGAAQLVDPTLGASVSNLSRMFGDLVTAMFLLSGGHHVLIHVATGMGGRIVPGSFLASELSIELLVNVTADIFEMGVMISAPVIVALLLTQFVMGLISKAVPTVNIFIVSFPLTIGIGLLLSSLSLPDISRYIDRHLRQVETSVGALTEHSMEVRTPTNR